MKVMKVKASLDFSHNRVTLRPHISTGAMADIAKDVDQNQKDTCPHLASELSSLLTILMTAPMLSAHCCSCHQLTSAIVLCLLFSNPQLTLFFYSNPSQ